jgi:hypothetical protein
LLPVLQAVVESDAEEIACEFQEGGQGMMFEIPDGLRKEYEGSAAGGHRDSVTDRQVNFTPGMPTSATRLRVTIWSATRFWAASICRSEGVGAALASGRLTRPPLGPDLQMLGRPHRAAEIRLSSIDLRSASLDLMAEEFIRMECDECGKTNNVRAALLAGGPAACAFKPCPGVMIPLGTKEAEARELEEQVESDSPET